MPYAYRKQPYCIHKAILCIPVITQEGAVKTVP
jgi:hypothetical protein